MYQPEKGSLIFSLKVKGRLPSLNALLSMVHWKRHKLKAQIAADFLSALRASEKGCSMKTTSSESTIPTFAATLESFLQMRQTARLSKPAKGKPKKGKKSTH